MSTLVIDGQAHSVHDPYQLTIDVDVDASGPRLQVRTRGAEPRPLTQELYVPRSANDMAVVLRGPRGFCTFVFSVRDGDAEQVLQPIAELVEDPSPQQQSSPEQAAPSGPLRWVSPSDGAWPRAATEDRDICATVVPLGYRMRFKVVLVSKADGEAIFIDPIIRNGNIGLRTRR
ncbi:MAG: hypothetical protein H6712_34875 [Myxococcales bacterium]|nr:hypothetical protein [Myxococcales bacterium]MCB9719082.1 hypothetical protein [Myxococcales bacterium]